MVQAIEQKHARIIIKTDKEKLKEALDIVLDTLGLPPCDDIHIARKMIRDTVKKDR